MANNYIDVTEKWLKEAKPNMGNIEFSSYVISSANKEYDSTNSILNFEKDDSSVFVNPISGPLNGTIDSVADSR